MSVRSLAVSALAFPQIVRHRELIGMMVRRDLAMRYRATAMGFLWAILNPLLTLLLYTYVFSIVLKVKFGADASTASFALYLFCGMLPWLGFSEGLGRCATVVVDNVNLVKKVVFPLEILPINVVLSALVTQGIGTAIFLPAIVLLGGALVALTARHTVTIDEMIRFHERYCFYVEPLIILCAVRAISGMTVRSLAAAGALAAVMVALSLGYVARALWGPVVGDSLSYSALRPVVEVLGIGVAIPATFAVMVAAIAAAVAALAAGRARFAGRLLAAYFVAQQGPEGDFRESGVVKSPS